MSTSLFMVRNCFPNGLEQIPEHIFSGTGTVEDEQHVCGNEITKCLRVLKSCFERRLALTKL